MEAFEKMSRCILGDEMEDAAIAWASPAARPPASSIRLYAR
jgi:hypothetical protein